MAIEECRRLGDEILGEAAVPRDAENALDMIALRRGALGAGRAMAAALEQIGRDTIADPPSTDTTSPAM